MSNNSAILDFYDDSRHELMSKVAMPSEMGRVPMNLLTPEQHSSLPDNEFGLIVLTKRASVLRKFPVNDPGNAWLSAQYFQHNHEKLAFPARFIAAKFIKEACDAYGVPSSNLVENYAARAGGDVEGNTFVEGSESSWMLRKLAQRELMDKQASVAEVDAVMNMPDDHFALVVHNGDGSVIRKYAMPDAAHVKLAANYFDKYAMQLPPEYRHRFARAVQSRAAELDVDINDNNSLSKWASAEWNRHVNAHLEQRKSLLPQRLDAHGILDKLASAISEGDTTPEDAAAALQTFDEATGLAKYYDRGLADPYASTMGKNASGWSAEVGGRTVTEEDLKKAAASKKLASYFGSSFAEQFAKQPVEVFESLPAPEKEVVAQVASGEA